LKLQEDWQRINRDLGGIIVIDFIDVYTATRRRSMTNKGIQRDRAKVTVLPMSALA
jgi:Ribonuclease G/E